MERSSIIAKLEQHIGDSLKQFIGRPNNAQLRTQVTTCLVDSVNSFEAQNPVVHDEATVEAIEALADEQPLTGYDRSFINAFVHKIKALDLIDDRSKLGIELFAVENMLSGNYIFKDVEFVRKLACELRDWLDFIANSSSQVRILP